MQRRKQAREQERKQEHEKGKSEGIQERGGIARGRRIERKGKCERLEEERK